MPIPINNNTRMLPANTTSSSSSAILTLLPQPPSSGRRNDFRKICFSQKYQFDCNFKNPSVQSMIQSVHCASIHPKYHDCYDCFAFETVHSTFIWGRLHFNFLSDSVASKKQNITKSIGVEIAAFSASLEPAMKFDPVLEIGGSRLWEGEWT